MKIQYRTLVLVLGAASLPLLAHHQFSSEYDANKPVTLTGTVTRVDWAAPHVNISMDAKTADGKTEQWKLEAATPSTLTQHGWSSTSVKNGDTITVNGYRALDGSNTASARSITLADGRAMPAADPAEDGGPQGERVAADTLPRTASWGPTFGLAGFLAIAGALGLRAFGSLKMRPAWDVVRRTR